MFLDFIVCLPVSDSWPHWPYPTASRPPWSPPAWHCPSRPPCQEPGEKVVSIFCITFISALSHLQIWRVTLTLVHSLTPLPVEVHVRADAVAALEPVQVCIFITGTLSSKEHVRADGLGIPKLVHSFGSGRSRRNRGWRWFLGPKIVEFFYFDLYVC